VPNRYHIFAGSFLLVVFTLFLTSPLLAFQKSKTVNANPVLLLTRTTTRHEVRRFGYGGTVTIIGAPRGSITVEGWPRSEVEMTADIELLAESEDDLNRLATVNTFVFDEDTNHLSLLSTGTHDRVFMKRVAKDFPKRLLNLPWKIDYRLHVPTSTDLEINAGSGGIKLTGVEGSVRLSASESETMLTLTGGIVSATIAAGNVRVVIPVRSWRGAGAEIRVAAGDLTIELPAGFNGDIDADILRSGKIVNSYEDLQPREKPGLTDQIVRARAGTGGAAFKFTLGVGTLFITKNTSQ
jgi:hypothetical protein